MYESGIKRIVDIVGGITGLILFLPISLIVIILIKVTSQGPFIFKQERVGLNGQLFFIFKFRTMYTNNVDDIHRQYVSKLINGECNENTYKITEDPRITPVGRILRKFSLDEIPQFYNVVIGDMSLVGPRPPLVYEVENYKWWHKLRIYSVKPGLTGLWQVDGRSRTSFDEMVRMDLKYKMMCSFMTDLKIICKTIIVLITTKGGY
jgi:lipopolysaccharide/colanic/teichoic acid biosynthesis glycosyltransferase